MPTPVPPPRGPESPLAALAAAYPLWRFEELPDGRWLAAQAPADVPVNQLTASRFSAVRAKTLVGIAAAVRDAHANRWRAHDARVAADTAAYEARHSTSSELTKQEGAAS